MARLTNKQASALSKSLKNYIQQPGIVDCKDTEDLAKLMHRGYPAHDNEQTSIQIYRELIVGKLLELGF